MIVLNIIPVGPDRTLETYDFFLETPEPDAMELDAIRYLDEVLQVEDIGLVESVQRGMNTPAFQQGRIVNDPETGQNVLDILVTRADEQRTRTHHTEVGHSNLMGKICS